MMTSVDIPGDVPGDEEGDGKELESLREEFSSLRGCPDKSSNRNSTATLKVCSAESNQQSGMEETILAQLRRKCDRVIELEVRCTSL